MAGVNNDSAADESLRELVDFFEVEIKRHLPEPSRLFRHRNVLSLIPPDKQRKIFDLEKRSSDEAVSIMLDCLKNSGVSWFRIFKQALQETGHKTLYKILNMEDVDVEKYEPLLHLYYCKFTSDVNAREITRQLLSCHILQREDMEQINAEGDFNGNSRAMIKLIFTLRDRNDKWFVHLVAATRKCGYLLDDINPRLKEAETLRTMESIINREVAIVANSEKRVGEREAKREIKVTADEFRRRQERGTDEVTAEQGSRLRDNKRSNDDLEDGEFNFQSCYPKEQAVVATVADDADDWRKMIDDLSRVQHGQTVTSDKQRPIGVSNQHGKQATQVKTTPESSISSGHDNLFSELITNVMQKITELLSAKCNDEPPVEHKLRRGVTVLAKICEVERRGSCRYRKIVEKLELYVQPIFDQNTRDYLWSCLRHLRVYNSALMINRACRTQDALYYINEQLSAVRDNHSLSASNINQTLDRLHSDMAGCLVEISQSAADNNLRLTHLENEILRHVECGRGGDTSVRRRGIVLCDSEEVADALLRWMKRGCQSLATLTLNPEKLNLPSKKSYCASAELFRRGHHLLVAVSSADSEKELLACDYTIYYTSNSSLLQDEISLQSTTVETSPYSDSSACSSMLSDSPVYELRCLNCHADSTRSSHLRLIKDHCITVDKDFASRADFAECIRTKTLQHWQKTGNIKCGKCDYDWGVRACYKGRSYDILKPTSFNILCPDASCVGPLKTWNEAPFKIDELRRRCRSTAEQ